MWDSILIALATLVPFLDADAAADSGRRAALDRLLDQAVMLHRTEPRRVETDYVYADPEADPDYALNLELAELELAGGFLSDTCVLEPEHVRGMRYMIAYVDVMRMLRLPDEEIAGDLIEYAGEDGERVRQLVDYVGLGNMRRMICLDYMRERLAQGIEAAVLREYINQIPDATSTAESDYPAASGAAVSPLAAPAPGESPSKS